MNSNSGPGLPILLGMTALPFAILTPAATGQVLAPIEARKEAALIDDFSGFSGFAGVGVESGTSYAGSDTRETGVAPLLYGIYEDRIYFSAGEIGLYWPLMDTEWRVKAGLGYEPGRDPSDHPALANMNTVDNTAVFAGGLYRQFGTAAFGLGFEADVADAGKGVVTFLGGSYNWHSDDRVWTLTAYGDVSFANAEHLRTEFGITPAEALASQANANPLYRYTSYTPSGGMKSFGIGAAARYRLAGNWLLTGSVSGEFFGSEATNSPLVREDYELEAVMGLAFTF